MPIYRLANNYSAFALLSTLTNLPGRRNANAGTSASPNPLAEIFMDIQTAHSDYRNEENYFAPEYEGENNALNRFYSLHPNLCSETISYLGGILRYADNWHDKYFVADLMYLYNPIPDQLLEPMLQCAIRQEDPSFNRIFLKPCIKSFGLERIKDLLDEKEDNGDTPVKEGVARLKYWLRPFESENEYE